MVLLVSGMKNYLLSRPQKRHGGYGFNRNGLTRLLAHKRRINFGSIRFSLPAWKDHFIRKDIEAGLIHYKFEETSITFFKRVDIGGNGISNIHFEEIGKIKFDHNGDLLGKNGNVVKRNGALINCKQGAMVFYIPLVDQINVFAVQERIISISPMSGPVIIGAFGLRIKLSADPRNIYYKDLLAGNMRYQVWPEGRLVFYRKVEEGHELIGETTKEELKARLAETGLSYINLPHFLRQFGVNDAPLHLLSAKDNGTPQYGFRAKGITYSLYITEDMVYAADLLSGSVYRREYHDRIEIGMAANGKFTLIGEIKTKKLDNLGPNQYVDLKAEVPELATLKKKFKYVASEKKDGNIGAECLTHAFGRKFALSADVRNIFTGLVKKGKVFLIINPREIKVEANGRVIVALTMDEGGDIFSGDKLIVPGDRKTVNLTKNAAVLDIEEGVFTYVKKERGKDLVQVRTAGVRFIAFVERQSVWAEYIRRRLLRWRRRGDVFELYILGLRPFINIIFNKTELFILEAGEVKKVAVPKSRSVNLGKILSIDMSAHPWMMYDHETIENMFRLDDLQLISVLIRNTLLNRVPVENGVKLSKMLLAQAVFMERAVRLIDDISGEQRIRMFCQALFNFIRIIEQVIESSDNGHRIRHSIIEYLDRIREHFIQLKKDNGDALVSAEMAKFKDGILTPYLYFIF